MEDDSHINAANELYYAQHRPPTKRRQADPFRNQRAPRQPRSSNSSSSSRRRVPGGGSGAGSQQHQGQASQHNTQPPAGAAASGPAAAQASQSHTSSRLAPQQQAANRQRELQQGFMDCNPEGQAQEQQQQQQQQQQQYRRQQQQRQYQVEQEYLRQQARLQDEAAMQQARELHEQCAFDAEAVARQARVVKQLAQHGRWRQDSPGISLEMLRLLGAPSAQVCSLCQGPNPAVRCWTCSAAGGPQPYCEACDAGVHDDAHMHKREKHTEGSWQQLPFAATAAAYFTVPPQCSSNGCPGRFNVSQPVDTKPLWYICSRGLIKLQRASFQCQLCSTVTWQKPFDFLQVGAWPASLTDRVKTIVQCELLQQWDSHRLCNPAATLSGFLSGIQHAASAVSFAPALAINRAAFRVAHSEWKKWQVETRMYVGQLNDLECPSCVPGERALHGDGNQKLFTWARNKEALRKPYYKDILFADPDVVRNDMLAVGKMLKNERADTHCGGHWSAATNQARRREKQEVTGRYVLTDARHGGPVAALNQIRTGERYSYALTLGLSAAAQGAGLRQLHIDIMCKWAGWMQRVSSKARQLRCNLDADPDTYADPDPTVQNLASRLEQLRAVGKDLCSARLVHSAAHGSLHAQSCQVLFQPQAVDGCGKTSGEAGEQLFSHLSPLGRTTCHQSVAGSTDCITEHCIEIARVKRAGQAAFLVGKLKKYTAQLPAAGAKLRGLTDSMSSHAGDGRLLFVQRMLGALKAHAKADMQGGAPDRDVLELFSLARSRLDAPLLSSFLQSSSLCENQQQHGQPQQPAIASVEVTRMVASIARPSTARIHQMAKSVLQERNERRYHDLLGAVAQGMPELAGIVNPTESQVIQALFSKAAEASVLTMQNKIEATCYNLGKQAEKRDATAARPKEQKRHSKKCAEIITVLGNMVEQYNIMRPYGCRPRTEAKLEDITQHNFAWANDYRVPDSEDPSVGEVVQVYGMKKTLEICDAYNEVQRIKEELALLPREMRAQLQYWEAVMDKQDRLIALLQVPASGPSTVADLAQQLQASGMQVCVAHRYLPDCKELAANQRAREGAVCVLRRAKREAFKHHQLAVQAFGPFNITVAAAAARAPEAETEAAQPEFDVEAATGGPEQDSEDDELGYSEDEACVQVDVQTVGGSSDEGSDEDHNI